MRTTFISVWADNWAKPKGWWTSIDDEGFLENGTPVEDMAPYYLNDEEQSPQQMWDTFMRIFEAVDSGKASVQGNLHELP